mgnify:CR=1 FL=1
MANLRGIIYPIKDNLRTLDDDICVKTLNICQQLARKSDKIAEALVPHYHIILPPFSILRDMHASKGSRRPQSSYQAPRPKN